MTHHDLLSTVSSGSRSVNRNDWEEAGALQKRHFWTGYCKYTCNLLASVSRSARLVCFGDMFCLIVHGVVWHASHKHAAFSGSSTKDVYANTQRL